MVLTVGLVVWFRHQQHLQQQITDSQCTHIWQHKVHIIHTSRSHINIHTKHITYENSTLQYSINLAELMHYFVFHAV